MMRSTHAPKIVTTIGIQLRPSPRTMPQHVSMMPQTKYVMPIYVTRTMPLASTEA